MLRRDDFEGFFVARTQALMELIAKAMGKSFPGRAFEGDSWESKNGNPNVVN
jgi:hypothetical protein